MVCSVDSTYVERSVLCMRGQNWSSHRKLSVLSELLYLFAGENEVCVKCYVYVSVLIYMLFRKKNWGRKRREKWQVVLEIFVIHKCLS